MLVTVVSRKPKGPEGRRLLAGRLYGVGPLDQLPAYNLTADHAPVICRPR
jgi:hypothetical protein